MVENKENKKSKEVGVNGVNKVDESNELLESHLEIFEKTESYIKEGLSNNAPLSEICISIIDYKQEELVQFNDYLFGLDKKDLEEVVLEMEQVFINDNLTDEEVLFLKDIAQRKWDLVKDLGDGFEVNIFKELLLLPFEILKIALDKTKKESVTKVEKIIESIKE